MTECKLGQALGCEGMDRDGNCTIYHPEGVAHRMEQGFCVFKNIRSANVGIYAIKRGKKRNPLKLAKAIERGKVAAPEEKV